MFVFGEVQDPMPETVKLVEDVVRGQIIEMVRRQSPDKTMAIPDCKLKSIPILGDKSPPTHSPPIISFLITRRSNLPHTR